MLQVKETLDILNEKGNFFKICWQYLIKILIIQFDRFNKKKFLDYQNTQGLDLNREWFSFSELMKSGHNFSSRWLFGKIIVEISWNLTNNRHEIPAPSCLKLRKYTILNWDLMRLRSRAQKLYKQAFLAMLVLFLAFVSLHESQRSLSVSS